LPEPQRQAVADCAEKNILRAVLRSYQIAQVMLAPNEECVKMLRTGTGKETFLMKRGIDRQLFSASKRDSRDGIFRLGFVGRLRPEKNLRFFVDLEEALRRDGLSNYRFMIVGDGSERSWLQRKLIQADFTGELHGEFLSRAYANMDLFVFPSETDTYGNVVSEALASGTPAVVTRHGGPKYQMQDGVTGFVAADEGDFIAKVKLLITNPKLHASLREGARAWNAGRSWENILEDGSQFRLVPHHAAIL
jgi:phosphatidylinositol alpha 1,6-mannosyltransferase